MDSKWSLTIFDTPGKNCPLNILTPLLISGGSLLCVVIVRNNRKKLARKSDR